MKIPVAINIHSWLYSHRRYITGCIVRMSLPVTVNIAAECLRTDCCILGDKKNCMESVTKFLLLPNLFWTSAGFYTVDKGKFERTMNPHFMAGSSPKQTCLLFQYFTPCYLTSSIFIPSSSYSSHLFFIHPDDSWQSTSQSLQDLVCRRLSSPNTSYFPH